MKTLFFVFTLLVVSFSAAAQNSVPSGTIVSLSLNKDVFAPETKLGAPADFVVLQDVIVKGTVLIPKGAKVRAAVVDVNKGGPHQGESRVKVQIYDVMAMDGSTVVLDNCYVFTMGDGGHKQRGALLLKGIGKNCIVK
ncbi:MAG TPA: hypothetical protein VK154_09260 [Chitinophagales bacterium]|nr:hypothetical protein [Chitinophagales bacterium]